MIQYLENDQDSDFVNVPDYLVLHSRNGAPNLEGMVQMAIRNQYMPTGGISMIRDDEYDDNDNDFYQNVIRKSIAE